MANGWRLAAPGLAACKRCMAEARPDTMAGYERELAETLVLYRDVDTLRRLNEFLQPRRGAE
jgi:hypothetical protein